MKRIAASLASVFLVTGCATYSLEELRRVEPVGTPFQKALSRYYKEFASAEEKQYDWIDSMHFADKGLMAAYGKDVLPEDPANWKIAEDKMPEIQIAYHSLKEALANGSIDNKPEMAARAQYYFDCWLEQQEEGWQDADISYCRDGFKDTMETLLGHASAAEPEEEIVAEIKGDDVVVDGKKEEPVAKVEPAPAPVTEKMPVVAPVAAEEADNAEEPAPGNAKVFSYVVFFEKKQKDISAAGQKAIEDVLGMAKSGGKYTYVLNSHTDRVGEDIENQKLTEERARIVRDALVAGGIDTDDIKIYAFGESDTPVKTADGVDEPANQRVEILLNE